MGVKDYAADIARALAFLSRVPVPSSVFTGDDGNLGRVARAFPAAGLLIALPATFAFGLLLWIHADPLLAGLIALTVQTLFTGALHEDGLSDTADGLGGGRDRERSLGIMKDSRIGTYGAIALVLSFGLRAASLAALARGLSPFAAALAIPAAAAISRGALVWHWHALPSAKTTGVAADAGRPDSAATRTALATAAVIAAILLWPAGGLAPVIACLLVVALCTFLFTEQVRRKLAGHTGDTIGATQQICEIATFCTLAMSI
jgi:adenosylcobinamide-GDP ribazoletransferase